MVEAENSVTGASTPVSTIPAVLPAGMERRRPGRREHVDPALIPLLRRKPDAEATLPSLELEEDRLADLAPSRNRRRDIRLDRYLGGSCARPDVYP